MPIYTYKAVTASGQELTRDAVAPNEIELRRELEVQGYLVKRITPQRMFFLPSLNAKVQPEDFLQCTQEVVTLLRAGLTVPEVLDLVADRPESPVLTGVWKNVLEDVRKGVQFSEACEKYPKIFDGLYISSLKTGERTGDLASPLARYQDYYSRRVALGTKMSMAMVYPLFLLGVLVAVLGLLFIFVMPRFVALYSDFNAALPLPTQVLMVLVRNLPVVLTLSVFGTLGLWVLYRGWSHTEAGRLWLDKAQQDLPVVSRFARPFMISQLSRTLSTLLSGGTSLTEALRVTRESIVKSNLYFSLKLDKVIQRVMDGESLSKAVGEEGLMSRQAVKLLAVAEASGQLGQMLQEIAASHERVLETRVQKAMNLIEPIFILLTGLLIGSVIVVMYLPIMHLSDIVK